MYCPECGVDGSGKFCVECGTKLSNADKTKDASTSKDGDLLTGDWTIESRYERLIRYPFVRDQITLAGQGRPNRVSGEQLLKLYDTVASPGVSLEKLSVAILPILDGIGVKTASQAEYQAVVAPGRLLLATLCALASGGYDIENVDQLSNSCIIMAFLPATLITNRGKIVVTIMQKSELDKTTNSAIDGAVDGAVADTDDAEETTVPADPVMQLKAATKISGQILDWGKGKRILAALLDAVENHAELRGYAKALPGANMPLTRLSGDSQHPETRCLSQTPPPVQPMRSRLQPPKSPPRTPSEIPEPKSLEELDANQQKSPSPPIRKGAA
ncbi:MAG: hypothetical protein MPJ50_18375 [Pirellulales bacterium]|nr:hypothetical protein [Pirellulales bacterium]